MPDLDTEHEHDDRLVAVLDEALAELRAKGAIDVAAWKERNPDLAGELPALLETLRNLEAKWCVHRIGCSRHPVGSFRSSLSTDYPGAA